MGRVKYIVLFCIATLLVNGSVYSQSLEASYKFWDENVQKRLLEELRSRSIPVRVDEEGKVLYPAEKFDEVKEIVDYLLREEYPPFSFNAIDEGFGKKLEFALRENGVNYTKEKRQEGYIYIWQKEDDALVKNLINEVLLLNIQQKKSQ